MRQRILVTSNAFVAQFLALPEYMVFKLPEGLSLDEASIVGRRMTTPYNAVSPFHNRGLRIEDRETLSSIPDLQFRNHFHAAWPQPVKIRLTVVKAK